jgi:hypothetical protein
MIKHTTRFLLLGNVVLGALFVIQLTVPAMQPKTFTALMPSWHRIPDLESATELSDSVVTANVVKVRKSALRIKAEGLPGNVDVIPGEVITLQVTSDDVKGQKKKGQTLELFHTGTSENQDGVAQLSIEHDPPYQVGEAYMLFTTTGPNVDVGGQQVGTESIVSPEGRWKIDPRGNVSPMSDIGWAKQLDKRSVGELRTRAARAHAAAMAGQGKLKRPPKTRN